MSEEVSKFWSLGPWNGPDSLIVFALFYFSPPRFEFGKLLVQLERVFENNKPRHGYNLFSRSADSVENSFDYQPEYVPHRAVFGCWKAFPPTLICAACISNPITRCGCTLFIIIDLEGQTSKYSHLCIDVECAANRNLIARQ